MFMHCKYLTELPKKDIYEFKYSFKPFNIIQITSKLLNIILIK